MSKFKSTGERHKGACQVRHSEAEGSERHTDSGRGGKGTRLSKTNKTLALLFFAFLSMIGISKLAISSGSIDMMVATLDEKILVGYSFTPEGRGEAELIEKFLVESDGSIEYKSKIKYIESGEEVTLNISKDEYESTEIGTKGNASNESELEIKYEQNGVVYDYTLTGVSSSSIEILENKMGESFIKSLLNIKLKLL